MTRDKIPELLAVLGYGFPQDVERACRVIKDTDRDDIIGNLILEIHRLKNNLASCRRAAKQLDNTRYNPYRDNTVRMEENIRQTALHITQVANDVGGKDWWK